MERTVRLFFLLVLDVNSSRGVCMTTIRSSTLNTACVLVSSKLCFLIFLNLLPFFVRLRNFMKREKFLRRRKFCGQWWFLDYDLCKFQSQRDSRSRIWINLHNLLQSAELLMFWHSIWIPEAFPFWFLTNHSSNEATQVMTVVLVIVAWELVRLWIRVMSNKITSRC